MVLSSREVRRKALGILSVSIAAALAGFVLAGCGGGDEGGEAPLLCYVGGTMRPVMEKLAAEYEKETGQKIEIDAAGSGELLIRIQQDKRGDLYVCHDPFLDMLMRKGLGRQGWTMALVTPTLVVQKGNPKKILSITDLARPGIKLGLTDPKHSTMGHIVPTIFTKAGLREQIEANVATRQRGGSGIANAVGMKDLDAGIVWDAVAHLRTDKLDAVKIEPQFMPIPEVDAITSATERVYDIGRIKVTMATLKASKRPEAARKFAEYVLKRGNIFVKEFGFTPAPEELKGGKLLVYCGAGIRHAMEEAAETFGRSNGAEMQMDYAGSGALISRLKLARKGDVYIPGDVWYLDEVAKEGLVASRKMVTWFAPVIIVRKGNPKNIRSLADLVKPGVKLALGNPEACQVGRLTEQVFKKNEIDAAAVQANTVFSSVTVNELGVQVKMDSTDAAIVWDAVAANFADAVEIVPIPTEQNIISNVAAGVLTLSQNQPLAQRFVDFLAGPEGKAILAKHHYMVEPPK